MRRVPGFQKGDQFRLRVFGARSVDLDDVVTGLHSEITGPRRCGEELREMK
jgi:hypothetical protein